MTTSAASTSTRRRSLRKAAAGALAGLVFAGVLGATAGSASAANGVNDLPAGGSGYGFEVRSCVDFVAWRLKQAGVAPANLGQYGNANQWDDMARKAGIRIDSTPAVGAVAHWDTKETSEAKYGKGSGTKGSGDYGHVAYVTSVGADGFVTIDEYNQNNDHAFHKSGEDGQATAVKAPRYLHFEDLASPYRTSSPWAKYNPNQPVRSAYPR